MIEVKWKSSTATNLNRIIPRLPVVVDVPRPTFAVCQNFIPLRQNLTLEFDGFGDSLTFRWEQIGGSLVDIVDPTSLDATVDLIGQPPDDRFFRLIVNEGRLNETEAIVPVFSRIVSSTGPGLSSTDNNPNAGVYAGEVIRNIAIFTPVNETFGSCSVTGLEYLYVTLTRTDPTTVVFVSLQIWNTANRQWEDEQIGDPSSSGNKFVILTGVSYRIKILWKRSFASPTLYEYYSDPISYTGKFEGSPVASSKGGSFKVGSVSEGTNIFWDIERIRRVGKLLDEPEQTETPVGGFSIGLVSVTAGVELDRIRRFKIELDDPEQTEDPVGGFSVLGVNNYQTFDISRVSGINISV